MTPKITFMVGFNDFFIPKGHMVIRGRLDLLYDPKGHGELYGLFDLVHDPRRSKSHDRSQ